MMLRLALHTVRARFGSYLASGLVMLTGTALLTGFASLLETGVDDGSHNGQTLTMLAAILGGWTVVIVAFGVVSTIALAVAQRERELALLRSIAATPSQVRRGVVAETLIVAVPAVLLGVLPGLLLGGFVLDRMIAFGAASAGTELHAGWFAIGIGSATALVAALVAALIASRRAANIPPVRALAGAAEAPAERPVRRGRLVTGVVFLGIGLSMGVTTLFMANGPLLASTAGPAGVAAAVGLALLSPVAVTVLGKVASGLLRSGGRLAGRNLVARSTAYATVVGPLVLLVGIAAGTIYMQTTEDSSHNANGSGAEIASANYLVVSMIIAFSAIAVINTLVSATRYRRREFGLLRLTGATHGQVIRMVVVESTLTTVIAAVLGAVAALVTMVPYSVVRIGSPVAAGSPWIFVGIVAVAFLLALVTTTVTTARALRAPAV